MWVNNNADDELSVVFILVKMGDVPIIVNLLVIAMTIDEVTTLVL